MAFIEVKGYAVVDSDPNTITELQSNHHIKKAVHLDGREWKFIDTNPTNEKWEIVPNIDLVDGKEDKINKQTDLTSADPEHYPNVSAVNGALKLKTDTGGYIGTSQDLDNEITALQNAQLSGFISYRTEAELLAHPNPSTTEAYRITNDPNSIKNGTYTYDGVGFIKDDLVITDTLDRDSLIKSILSVDFSKMDFQYATNTILPTYNDTLSEISLETESAQHKYAGFSGFSEASFYILKVNFIEYLPTQWLCFGRVASGMLAFRLTQGTSSIVIFNDVGGFSNVSGTATVGSIDLSSEMIVYNSSADGVRVYQGGVEVATLTKETLDSLNVENVSFGIVSNGVGSRVVCRLGNVWSDFINNTYGTSVNIPSDNMPLAGQKMVLLGDSITIAGPGADYESQMENLTGCDVVRVGRSGQTWANILSSQTVIDEVKSENPDIIVMHSINDHRVSETLGSKSSSSKDGTTIGGVKELFEQFIDHNNSVKILFCTPLTYAEPDNANVRPSSIQPNNNGDYLSDFRREFINICAAYAVPVVDLTTEVEFRQQIEGTINRIYTSDGVHPNESGYFLMTDKINKRLEYLYS